MASTDTDSRRAIALAVVLGGAGTMHFVLPRPFDSLIPRRLPGSPRLWTYASGVAELGCALAVAVPATRRLGGILTALLFLVVLPGNVKMAVDWHRQRKPLPLRVIALARLPLQWPLIRWATKVSHSAR